MKAAIKHTPHIHYSRDSLAYSKLKWHGKKSQKQFANDDFWDPVVAMEELRPWLEKLRLAIPDDLQKLKQLDNKSLMHWLQLLRPSVIFLIRLCLLARPTDCVTMVDWRVEDNTLWLLFKRKGTDYFHWEAVLANEDVTMCLVFWFQVLQTLYGVPLVMPKTFGVVLSNLTTTKALLFLPSLLIANGLWITAVLWH